jgi:hypothetical protein
MPTHRAHEPNAWRQVLAHPIVSTLPLFFFRWALVLGHALSTISLNVALSLINDNKANPYF